MLVEQVGRDDLDPRDQVLDALVRVMRGSAHDANDVVALREEVLRQVGTVLAGDAGDEGSRHEGSPVGGRTGRRVLRPAMRRESHLWSPMHRCLRTPSALSCMAGLA